MSQRRLQVCPGAGRPLAVVANVQAMALCAIGVGWVEAVFGVVWILRWSAPAALVSVSERQGHLAGTRLSLPYSTQDLVAQALPCWLVAAVQEAPSNSPRQPAKAWRTMSRDEDHRRSSSRSAAIWLDQGLRLPLSSSGQRGSAASTSQVAACARRPSRPLRVLGVPAFAVHQIARTGVQAGHGAAFGMNR